MISQGEAPLVGLDVSFCPAPLCMMFFFFSSFLSGCQTHTSECWACGLDFSFSTNKPIALNAATFASVCLASRLGSLHSALLLLWHCLTTVFLVSDTLAVGCKKAEKEGGGGKKGVEKRRKTIVIE